MIKRGIKRFIREGMNRCSKGDLHITRRLNILPVGLGLGQVRCSVTNRVSRFNVDGSSHRNKRHESSFTGRFTETASISEGAKLINYDGHELHDGALDRCEIAVGVDGITILRVDTVSSRLLVLAALFLAADS